MAGVVVLDTGAVLALAARPTRETTRRLHAALSVARRRGALVRVPSAVLAEAYRGGSQDPNVDRAIDRAGRVVTTGRRVARLAGGLLASNRLDSCHVVDALVVATVVALGGGIVVTGDPDEMNVLAAPWPHVEVWAL